MLMVLCAIGLYVKSYRQILENPRNNFSGGWIAFAGLIPFRKVTLDAKKGDVRKGKGFYGNSIMPPMTIHHTFQTDVRKDLEVALNYGQAIVHHPPYSDWQCCLTSGTTYAWDSTLRMLTQRGDYVLMEEYTFSSAQETALPLGLKIAPVPMDNQGLRPDRLDEILTSWNVQARGAAKPHVLYMIPTGHNPTGCTQPASRRQAIYMVAQRHDLCIVEDEPYFFLQSRRDMASESQAKPIDDQKSCHEQFIRNLIPSYLSMDMDGRVLRLDSFSKVLAPGLRVGWIVGPEQLVERFTRGCETSNQNPSGVSQLMIYKLLDEHWGHSGYLDRLMELQRSYAVRRNDMIRACEIYLPREVVTWEVPIAGMFHWIGVDWRKHPCAESGLSPEDIEENVFQAAVQAGVLLCRGSWFRAGGRAIEGSLYFRTTYAAAESHKISEAVKRLGKAFRLEFQLAE
ncbi:aromatic amino acid aminotransferase [Penicillium nucicola]|uniref:aromatic amino acid aminotransferase n=1 Tax=Penicillium nucicola TaxID=1850975 RepID=UPI00254522B0|nr:aromatic amino acid aminotransferase [Penicillium nucicola]KAJ5776305.1 aromatic amino acid aminotransferase [Penicillium nucicola]